MEKLMYVLWKRSDVSTESFGREILERLAGQLIDAGARGLAVNLADDQAAFAQALRITQRDEPMIGTISIWMDSALQRRPLETIISASSARFAGYLVLESVPLVNTKHLVASGKRVPGICTVAFLEKPDALTYAEWLERWQGEHTQVAIETQSTFLYIQNVLVRPLTPDAPPWTAIVEECFPAAAATDPLVFYNADGSPEILQEHQRRMFKSVERFIDFSRFDTIPMSMYVVKPLG